MGVSADGLVVGDWWRQLRFLDVKYQTKDPIKSCTYQNWGKRLDDDCIDYIMISKTGFRVNSYNVVRTTYDGVYPSDHFPITASLTLTQG